MKEFTEDEKTIAMNIDKRYKWMARDRDGCLYVFDEKPKKLLNEWNVIFNGLSYGFVKLDAFSHMFSSVKWEDDESTRISDIYDPKILNDTEREYIKTILKPFHEEVDYIQKLKDYLIDDSNYRKEFLYIKLYDGEFTFPDFDAGKMYAGMKLNKKYTLNELGITYPEGK